MWRKAESRSMLMLMHLATAHVLAAMSTYLNRLSSVAHVCCYSCILKNHPSPTKYPHTHAPTSQQPTISAG